MIQCTGRWLAMFLLGKRSQINIGHRASGQFEWDSIERNGRPFRRFTHFHSYHAERSISHNQPLSKTIRIDGVHQHRDDVIGRRMRRAEVFVRASDNVSDSQLIWFDECKREGHGEMKTIVCFLHSIK